MRDLRVISSCPSRSRDVALSAGRRTRALDVFDQLFVQVEQAAEEVDHEQQGHGRRSLARSSVCVGLGSEAESREGGRPNLAPLTAAGIAGVAGDATGAASGVVNVAHQLGGSLGLGGLVTVYAAADQGLAYGISVSLTFGTIMLAVALVVALIVQPRSAPLSKQRGRPTP
jgi:hypothetical protein